MTALLNLLIVVPAHLIRPIERLHHNPPSRCRRTPQVAAERLDGRDELRRSSTSPKVTVESSWEGLAGRIGPFLAGSTALLSLTPSFRSFAAIVRFPPSHAAEAGVAATPARELIP